MRRTRAIAEGAMAIALFAVLLLVVVYLPLINIIALFFLPLPFVVYVIRNDIKAGIALFFAAAIVSFVLAGAMGPLAVLLTGLGGVVTGWLYRQRRPAFGVLLGGSLAYTASTIGVLILSMIFLHINLIDQYVHFLNVSIDNAAKMGASLDAGQGDKLADLKKQVGQARYLAPFLFVFTGVAFALITQLIAAPLLKRIGLARYVELWVPFREWRFPKTVLWFYLVVLIIGLFQSFTPGSAWFSFYINVLMILQMIMLLQGITFIFFYFHMKKIYQGVGIFVVVGSILISPVLPVSVLIRILGILDIGFDLRTRLQAK